MCVPRAARVWSPAATAQASVRERLCAAPDHGSGLSRRGLGQQVDGVLGRIAREVPVGDAAARPRTGQWQGARTERAGEGLCGGRPGPRCGRFASQRRERWGRPSLTAITEAAWSVPPRHAVVGTRGDGFGARGRVLTPTHDCSGTSELRRKGVGAAPGQRAIDCPKRIGKLPNQPDLLVGDQRHRSGRVRLQSQKRAARPGPPLRLTRERSLVRTQPRPWSQTAAGSAFPVADLAQSQRSQPVTSPSVPVGPSWALGWRFPRTAAQVPGVARS